MNELLKQTKWQFLIFQRNNLSAMIIGIAAFYMLAIYFLKSLGNPEKLATLIILADTSLIGFLFIGISIILEKNQEVLSALFSTPINHHFFLISKAITLSAICLFCALAIILIAKGFSFNLLHFSIGTLSVTIIFSLVGVYIVSYTTEILHYILRSIPILALMSLPLLNYFELTNLSILKLFPMQGSLYLIANSISESPDFSEIILGYISIIIWIPLLYWFVFRTFKAKFVNA